MKNVPLPSISNCNYWNLFKCLAVFLLCFSGLSSAVAATFTVSNTNDSGAGSLRQAIADANSNGEADTINFSTSGTITLTGGEIDITEALTINGNNTTTISGNNASRIFKVTSAELNLSDLTLTKGNDSGGAIYAMKQYGSKPSNVMINHCTFTKNHGERGGAMYVAASNLTVKNSRFSDNTAEYLGGAIEVISTSSKATIQVTIRNSIFSNNTAESYGGAIVAEHHNNGSGKLDISDSIFLQNQAKERYGGAIFTMHGVTVVINNSILSENRSFYRGGAIGMDHGASLFVNNSLFSKNQSDYGTGGAIGMLRGNISNSTFWKNQAGTEGGAIAVDGKSTIRNNTLVGNRATNGTIQFGHGDTALHSNILLNNISSYYGAPKNCRFQHGSIDPNSAHNLMDEGKDCLSNGSNGNIIDATLSVDSVLEGLEDNGCATPAGFGTSARCVKTMKLTENSPALDKGSNIGNLTSDQRGNGYPRTSNGQTDIGAYEESGGAYTIGGTVSGLDETANGEPKGAITPIYLQVYINLVEHNLTLEKNGDFTLGTSVDDNSIYFLGIRGDIDVIPKIGGAYDHQKCSITEGANGQVNAANITNIKITCTYKKFAIGGNVSGLNGTVVLQNGSHSTTVSGKGTVNFAFDPVRNGDYTVTVKTHPAGQHCQVTSGGTGKLRGQNINSVKVTCSSYKVGRIFADSFEK